MCYCLNSLFTNISNDNNTAVGYYTLYHNTGYENNAVGNHVLEVLKVLQME